MKEECLFKTLNDAELLSIDAGGLFLAILSGIATVVGTIGAAVAAPPGTKFAVASKIAAGGIFLTYAAYALDTI